MVNSSNHEAGLKKVPRRRYFIIVLSSVLIMACSGSVYAWSVFVAPLKAGYGITTAETQLIFGLIIGCFTVTMLFVDRVVNRFGPRFTAAIGAVLFAAGFLLASYSGGRMVLLLPGISMLSGAGMGFCYVTVLTNLVKWFPAHKGLATGVAVAGFGGGAVLLSQITQPLLARGLEVLAIFRIVGVLYGLIVLASAFGLSAPQADGKKASAAHISLKTLGKDRRFWVLCYTFFAGSFAGLMFIGNLKPMGLFYGVGEGAAVLAIGLLSVGNAGGRIGWGQVYDAAGGKKSVVTALFLLAIFTLLLTASRDALLFTVLSLIVGLCYGANFVLYASEVSHIFGIHQLGFIYPIVSLAYGIAGIAGPLVGGLMVDVTGTYYIPVIISAVVCASGALVYALLMPEKQASRKKSLKIIKTGRAALEVPQR